MKGSRSIAATLVVSLLAGSTLEVAAQPAEGIDTAAGINAHRVDGRHAIKSTGNKNKRRGKLMAFAASGYLPTNIVKGGVATVAALQSATGAVNEADNPVHWNQIQGVPPGVLAADTTRSFIAPGSSGVIAPGDQHYFELIYPIGLDVETSLIPVVNNAAFYLASGAGLDPGEVFVRSPDGASIIHYVAARNVGGVASEVKLRVTVWNDSYLSPSAAAKKIKVTALRKLPRKYRP